MEASTYYTFEDSKDKVAGAAKPLSRGDIFWGVFGGMWAFGISGGIVAAVIYALMK